MLPECEKKIGVVTSRVLFVPQIKFLYQFKLIIIDEGRWRRRGGLISYRYEKLLIFSIAKNNSVPGQVTPFGDIRNSMVDQSINQDFQPPQGRYSKSFK